MQYTVKKPNQQQHSARGGPHRACELIVTGRGLGFGVKPGYKIEAETVERSYRMTSPAVQQKLVELLEQIPYEHLLLTDELVAMIRSRVNYPLNESLLITLADHISFAIQRSEQGIRFSNPLMAPIREFYPEEYRLGMECLAAIRQRCHADLSDDEGGFIALHIVNAELNTTMSVVNDVTRLCGWLRAGGGITFITAILTGMHWISAALQCICVFLRSAYFKKNRSRKTIPTTKCSAP